jgi:hypothetical protein
MKYYNDFNFGNNFHDIDVTLCQLGASNIDPSEFIFNFMEYRNLKL